MPIVVCAVAFAVETAILVRGFAVERKGLAEHASIAVVP